MLNALQRFAAIGASERAASQLARTPNREISTRAWEFLRTTSLGKAVTTAVRIPTDNRNGECDARNFALRFNRALEDQKSYLAIPDGTSLADRLATFLPAGRPLDSHAVIRECESRGYATLMLADHRVVTVIAVIESPDGQPIALLVDGNSSQANAMKHELQAFMESRGDMRQPWELGSDDLAEFSQLHATVLAFEPLSKLLAPLSASAPSDQQRPKLPMLLSHGTGEVTRSPLSEKQSHCLGTLAAHELRLM